MNEKQAIAKLKKLIGPKLAWRTNAGALSAPERAEQGRVSQEMRATERELKDALDARRAELLKDPVYLDLRQRWHAAKEAADRAASKSWRKPIEVGRMGKMFFTVLASGDTWQDVVEQVERERP